MICPICEHSGADKYQWCRKCISRAARGAARYFLGLTGRQKMSDRMVGMLDDPHHRGQMIAREASKWQRKFKKKLLRREESSRL
jgi:hypothetical protein